MSPNETRRPRERDVLKLHRFVLREAEEPGEARASGPWWLWAAVVLTVFIGGVYLGRHFGSFGVETHIGYVKPGTVPARAPPRIEAVAASGEAVYAQHCASCHQPDGRGLPGAFPPLAGSEWVTGDTDRLIDVILNGLSGSITVAGRTYNGVMPAWKDQLTDGEIAAVASFIRQMGDNDAPPVDAAAVARRRKAAGG
jgi:mono/diheme cytochrome c family protein